MIDTSLFKKIKDKKLKSQYEALGNHFIFLNTLKSLNEFNLYKESLQAYKNGYTSKDKLYKHLRLNLPKLNIDLYLKYIQNVSLGSQEVNIKRYDDLKPYALNQSSLLYFCLLMYPDISKNNNLLDSIAMYDILSAILLQLPDLMSNQKSIIPTQLLRDYAIEFGLNHSVSKNIQFIYLLDFFNQKKELYLTELKKSSFFVSKDLYELIYIHLESIENKLKSKISPILINHKR